MPFSPWCLGVRFSKKFSIFCTGMIEQFNEDFWGQVSPLNQRPWFPFSKLCYMMHPRLSEFPHDSKFCLSERDLAVIQRFLARRTKPYFK